ncbi:MAG: ferrochelatase [Planctomycetota bacterium]|jgi:ferrochelatase
MSGTNLESCPFDAILVMAFGGPGGVDEVRPFIERVVGSRRLSVERMSELVGRYEMYGGGSAIREITLRQAEGLQHRLKGKGIDLPVYVGMRNWHPFIKDTLLEMEGAGIKRAIGFIATAHQSYSSCFEYKRSVLLARRELIEAGRGDVAITYVDRWYDHELFVSAHAGEIERSLAGLDADLGEEARIIFTAHSIPLRMAEECRYREQLSSSSLLVAERLGRDDWALVYESRSGRPEEVWLEPDICDYLRAEAAKGLAAAVISPIGFVCDHVELLFDLDHRAAGVCRELGLPMVRAEALNDHPLFLDMMADVVQKTCERYCHCLPLEIVGAGK